MYYINCFFVYSIVGFVLETLVALITKTSFNSGFLYGFWTPVYGFGAVIILLVSEYFFKNLHLNRFLETIIVFVICAIVLSLLEALGGIVLEKIFKKVYWDYSNHRFHIGHYISLEMTVIWGIASVIFIYIINPFLKNIIKKIPFLVTVLLIILFVIDNIFTFISKKGKL